MTEGRVTASVDAMGGDHGPAIVIEGCKEAHRSLPHLRFLLHGDEELIRPELKRCGLSDAVARVQHTDKRVLMDDKPASAMRRGKGSSMWNAVYAVRQGEADVVVSAGNKELLHLIAAGEKSVFGFVIEAHNVTRHRDLISEARRRGFDVILDPKTQQMGLPGGHTPRLAGLPWGKAEHHKVADFDGDEGRAMAEAIVQFALKGGFTQLILPTHVLTGPNDPWLRRDIRMSQWVAQAVKRLGAELDLIYSLAVPLAAHGIRPQRRCIQRPGGLT